MITTRNRLLAAAIVASLIVAADQITKYMILTWLPIDDGYEVIPGFMNIVHARNPGAAFSFLSGLNIWFFVAVSVVAVVVIIWLLLDSKESGAILVTGYSLFLGGAVGNLIDRLRFGEVIDFIDISVGSFHWPAFNVADSALSIGTACFFIHILSSRPRNTGE